MLTLAGGATAGVVANGLVVPSGTGPGTMAGVVANGLVIGTEGPSGTGPGTEAMNGEEVGAESIARAEGSNGTGPGAETPNGEEVGAETVAGAEGPNEEEAGGEGTIKVGVGACRGATGLVFEFWKLETTSVIAVIAAASNSLVKVFDALSGR